MPIDMQNMILAIQEWMGLVNKGNLGSMVIVHSNRKSLQNNLKAFSIVYDRCAVPVKMILTVESGSTTILFASMPLRYLYRSQNVVLFFVQSRL